MHPKISGYLKHYYQSFNVLDLIIVDDRAEHVKKKTINKSKNGLPGPIKKSPLININVSVKNIKAHTVAMSADDNAGFKDEYNVMQTFHFFQSFKCCISFIRTDSAILTDKSTFCQQIYL